MSKEHKVTWRHVADTITADDPADAAFKFVEDQWETDDVPETERAPMIVTVETEEEEDGEHFTLQRAFTVTCHAGVVRPYDAWPTRDGEVEMVQARETEILRMASLILAAKLAAEGEDSANGARDTMATAIAQARAAYHSANEHIY